MIYKSIYFFLFIILISLNNINSQLFIINYQSNETYTNNQCGGPIYDINYYPNVNYPPCKTIFEVVNRTKQIEYSDNRNITIYIIKENNEKNSINDTSYFGKMDFQTINIIAVNNKLEKLEHQDAINIYGGNSGLHFIDLINSTRSLNIEGFKFVNWSKGKLYVVVISELIIVLNINNLQFYNSSNTIYCRQAINIQAIQKLSIKNSIFINSPQFDKLYFQTVNLLITDSSFLNNNSTFIIDGITENTTINNCIFENNYGSGVDMFDGSFFRTMKNGSINIKNTIFNNNTMARLIFAQPETGNININILNCSFYDNLFLKKYENHSNHFITIKSNQGNYEMILKDIIISRTINNGDPDGFIYVYIPMKGTIELTNINVKNYNFTDFIVASDSNIIISNVSPIDNLFVDGNNNIVIIKKSNINNNSKKNVLIIIITISSFLAITILSLFIVLYIKRNMILDYFNSHKKKEILESKNKSSSVNIKFENSCYGEEDNPAVDNVTVKSYQSKGKSDAESAIID